MEYLQKEKNKIDDRIGHITAYKTGHRAQDFMPKRAKLESKHEVMLDHNQNKTVNRLIGFKDSHHDILSNLVREEWVFEERRAG